MSALSSGEVIVDQARVLARLRCVERRVFAAPTLQMPEEYVLDFPRRSIEASEGPRILGVGSRAVSPIMWSGLH